MKRFYILSILLLSYTISFSQSSHYWTESYGTRSMLLNGAVIGSVQDLGAVYYNPARLSQFKSPAFVVAGQVYQLSTLRLENALGDGIDLKKSNFGGGPSLVSGTFELKFMEKSKFAYAFLTRTQSSNNFTYSVDVEGDYVKYIPGSEFYSGQITSQNNVSDEWMGLSWSHPLSDKWSIGISGFYSSLERNAGIRLDLQAHSDSLSQTGMYTDARSYAFSSQSILGKLGFSYKGERLTAGLVVTTPKLEGLGSGSIRYEKFLAGVDTTSDGQADDAYILSSQSDLAQQHKSPWAIGLGAGIRLGKRSLLHLSTEWYSAIPTYTILQSEEFIGQSDKLTYQMTINDQLASVFNYGIGLEVYINEHLSLFASYATDNSAVQSDPDLISDLNLTVKDNNLRADRNHLGFGTDIKTNFADLTLGAMYAFSSETVKRSFSIDEGNDPVTDDIKVYYGRWRFLIGFEFHFIDNLKEKLEKKVKIKE